MNQTQYRVCVTMARLKNHDRINMELRSVGLRAHRPAVLTRLIVARQELIEPALQLPRLDLVEWRLVRLELHPCRQLHQDLMRVGLGARRRTGRLLYVLLRRRVVLGAMVSNAVYRKEIRMALSEYGNCPRCTKRTLPCLDDLCNAVACQNPLCLAQFEVRESRIVTAAIDPQPSK